MFGNCLRLFVPLQGILRTGWVLNVGICSSSCWCLGMQTEVLSAEDFCCIQHCSRDGPDWIDMEIKKRQVHLYNKILQSDGLGSLMEKPQNPGSSASLLYTAEQRGMVTAHGSVKEEGFMTFDWTNTSLANLDGEKVSGGEQSSDIKHPEEERYNENFLHTLKHSYLDAPEKTLPSLWGLPGKGFATPMGLSHWSPFVNTHYSLKTFAIH